MIKDSLPKVLPTNFSDIKLVNKLAEFFQNKVIALRSSLFGREVVKECNFNPVQPNASICMSQFSHITKDQFNLILSSLNNKNYMFDLVPLNLLKLCPAAINLVLHYIVSRSLAEASFLGGLKHATITPIIKNTNLEPELSKNYQPIGNTLGLYVAKFSKKLLSTKLMII